MSKSSTPATSTALAERPANTALALATDGDPRDFRGKESIGAQDVTLPRLAVAQKTSPQLEPDKPEYIDGLKLYQIFNTMTQQVYGNGPVEFAVVRYDKKALQFDRDLNIVDFNVPVEFDLAKGEYKDARLNFTTGEDGKRTKPLATLFHEFIVIMADGSGPAVLSLKGTGGKTAKRLNSLLQFCKGPAWTSKFAVTSRSKSSGGFTYAIFEVNPSGKSSDELRQEAENAYEALKGATIHTDREGADESASDDPDKAPF